MTSDRGRRVMTLARHELRSAVRSRALVTLMAVLVLTTIASVYIGAADYRSELADYTAYKAAAQAGGITQIAPSPLALLSLLQGAVEYLEIIGAVIAITLGYLSVSRERANRTLALIRSRPVTTGELAAGATLGALAVISTIVAASALVGIVCLGVIGHDWIDAGQALKLLLAYLASIVYMTTFYGLGVLCTTRSRVAANGLMVALAIWLLVVLVIPQIGDTLDSDNQVPGGLFASLGLDRAGETAVLAHYSTYEHVRTGIEASSLAKHYERFGFAMIDVKEKYRGFSLGHMLSIKRIELEWLGLYAMAIGVGLRRTLRRQSSVSQGGTS